MDPAEVVGLILARGGSQAIPLKNIRPLQGRPLILRSLECMLEFGRFSSIWVSTDHPQIANCVLEAYPCVHIFHRSPEHAHDTASSIAAVREFMHAQSGITHVALIQCTSPFLGVAHLERAWDLTLNQGYQSVFSVTRQKKLRWSEIRPGACQYTTPLNFNPAHRPRRQDWAGELVENGMFYWASRDLIEQGVLQGTQSAYVEVDPEDSLEIDTELDWMLAELRLSRE